MVFLTSVRVRARSKMPTLSSFPSQTLQLTHLICTLLLTLFPRIPIRGTAGTITEGGWGQAVFSTPQIPDRVSCSTNTTSPLFLRLLIPRIRRHGWVMTEMISPSTAPATAPPASSYISQYRSTPGPYRSTGSPSAITVLASPSSLLNPALSFCSFCFKQFTSISNNRVVFCVTLAKKKKKIMSRLSYKDEKKRLERNNDLNMRL